MTAEAPRRDDEIAAWLKGSRDEYVPLSREWNVLDRMLDEYQKWFGQREKVDQ